MSMHYPHASGLTRSISRWFPMTEPCGINVLLDLHMGMRVDFTQGEAGDFLSIMTI